MSVLDHGPSNDPWDDDRERSHQPTRSAGASDSHHRALQPSAARLVGQLRDDCNDVGVTARGFNLPGFERAVRSFARDAKRLNVPVERMLVLLKTCLADQGLPDEDRDTYARYTDEAVRAAIDEFFGDSG